MAVGGGGGGGFSIWNVSQIIFVVHDLICSLALKSNEPKICHKEHNCCFCYTGNKK